MGDRVLEILPKVDKTHPPETCRGVLLRLLKSARVIPGLSDASVHQHTRAGSLLEVFIRAFFETVLLQVRAGLLRQYRTDTADLPFVRGRIWLQRQFSRNANRPDVVACRYDELTADNVWNQTIKAALRAVRPWIVSAALNRTWTELIVVFDEVADIEPSSAALIHTRQTERYKPAIAWARLILGMLTPNLRSGETEAPSLLFEMNKLFERAVTNRLRKDPHVIAARVTVRDQDTSRALAIVDGSLRQAFPLRPDITINRGHHAIAVADAKWKVAEVDADGVIKPSDSDAYQMHAYATAFSCNEVCLVYPWHSGMTSQHDTAFVIETESNLQHLTVICIDVGTDGLPIRYGARVFQRLAKVESSAIAHS